MIPFNAVWGLCSYNSRAGPGYPRPLEKEILRLEKKQREANRFFFQAL